MKEILEKESFLCACVFYIYLHLQYVMLRVKSFKFYSVFLPFFYCNKSAHSGMRPSINGAMQNSQFLMRTDNMCIFFEGSPT